MGEEEQEDTSISSNAHKLIEDLQSFLSQLESEGYTKESLVLLLAKFETLFEEDSQGLPPELKKSLGAFIQHGFEYAESQGNQGNQAPLIQDLEKLESSLIDLRQNQKGDSSPS